MKINETSIARLLWFAAKGQSLEAQKYAGHIFKHGTDLSVVRAEIESMILPGFYFEMLTALPWLDVPSFENPLLVDDTPTPSRNYESRIIEIIGAAKRDGVVLTALRGRFSDRKGFDAALAGLVEAKKIIGHEMPTAGRPAMTYWLAELCPHGFTESGEFVLHKDIFPDWRV